MWLLSVVKDAIFKPCTHGHTKSRSQARYHAHWSGNDTSAQEINCARLAQALPVVVGKVYEHHIGEALHSPTNL